MPPPELPSARVTSVFPQGVASLPDLRPPRGPGRLPAYLGLDARPEGDDLVVRQDDTPVLTAGFDELGRLARLEATLHA